MKRFCTKYLPLLIAFTCLFGTASFSQAPAIQTSVDSNEILIGQHLHIKVAVNFPAGKYRVNFLSVPDSMRHFELIGEVKADSTFTDNQLTGINQTITLTSFDSGKWNLPVFKINVLPSAAGKAMSLYTDSLPITVSFSTDRRPAPLRGSPNPGSIEIFRPVRRGVCGLRAGHERQADSPGFEPSCRRGLRYRGAGS